MLNNDVRFALPFMGTTGHGGHNTRHNTEMLNISRLNIACVTKGAHDHSFLRESSEQLKPSTGARMMELDMSMSYLPLLSVSIIILFFESCSCMRITWRKNNPRTLDVRRSTSQMVKRCIKRLTYLLSPFDDEVPARIKRTLT